MSRLLLFFKRVKELSSKGINFVIGLITIAVLSLPLNFLGSSIAYLLNNYTSGSAESWIFQGYLGRAFLGMLSTIVITVILAIGALCLWEIYNIGQIVKDEVKCYL